MPYVPPERYRRAQPERRKRRGWVYIPFVVLLLATTINYLRPLPAAQTSFTFRTPPTTTAVDLDWPSGGQAAVAASGYGVLATYGEQKPISTASITKVILALCVLDKQPIAQGSEGATYTIAQQDVDSYNYYVENVGSRLPVQAGQKLTEYQAIQALLIPSANNIAESLVSWVFGDQASYAAYATQYLQQNSLYNTKIGSDASGYDPSTVSTASDLAKLGLLALQNPVIMEIGGQESATFPIAGKVDNWDTVLGQNGITGLKTGNNEVNLGAFLFTATAHYGGKDLQLTGAVLDAPDLQSALDESVQLVGSMQNDFEQVTIAARNQQVGLLTTVWGESVPIRTKDSLQLIRWKGSALHESHLVRDDVKSGKIGTMQVHAGDVASKTNLVLAEPVDGPNFWWRLTRF